MCIAIYKPMGKDMPSKTTLKNCFTNNPDGAGYMYAFGDKVYINKGYETFNAFYRALKKTISTISKNKGNDLSMVFHFRISTQGGVQKALCHPYPLSDNYDDMKKLHTTTDIGIAHNGIISLTSDSKVNDHNDTMEFIKEILYPMIDNRRNFYKSKKLLQVVDYLLDGYNKLAIMDGSGYTTLIGNWNEDNGLFYSNDSYKSVRKFVPISWYDNWDYPVITNKKSTIVPKTNGSLTERQIDSLKMCGYCYCEECGEYLYLDYDYKTSKYRAICPECGTSYEVSKEQAIEFCDYDSCFEYSYNY